MGVRQRGSREGLNPRTIHPGRTRGTRCGRHVVNVELCVGRSKGIKVKEVNEGQARALKEGWGEKGVEGVGEPPCPRIVLQVWGRWEPPSKTQAAGNPRMGRNAQQAQGEGKGRQGVRQGTREHNNPTCVWGGEGITR